MEVGPPTGLSTTSIPRRPATRSRSPSSPWPTAYDAPPRPFRKIDSRRPLQLGQGRFEFYDEDLWERSLRDYGSVQGDPNG